MDAAPDRRDRREEVRQDGRAGAWSRQAEGSAGSLIDHDARGSRSVRQSSSTPAAWLRCRPMETLLDLLDRAVARYADRPALRAHRDDGHVETWTYRDLGLRARAAAWRLRALGLEPGDRLLTWSPSMPELPAVYFGAMRVGLVLVPLDLRMAPDADRANRGARRARHLALGTGRDAPDPREAGLGHFPTTTVEALAAPPDALPGRLGSPARDVGPAPLGRPVRPDLHVRHDRRGRRASCSPIDRPRKHRGDATGSSRPWSTGS